MLESNVLYSYFSPYPSFKEVTCSDEHNLVDSPQHLRECFILVSTPTVRAGKHLNALVNEILQNT